jgi:NAD(P)-dependent dehydrogenase (short-subunit alcohol dehydrogenase family)
MPAWTTTDIPSQDGRLAIVTGPGGLGYETALALARAGAQVILAGRSEAKGQAATDTIRSLVPRANVIFEPLDLASLASVADFATRVAGRAAAVDLLVNNAGVMAPPARRVTADGFELQLGTNHLGHFALTARLLPLLRQAPHPRVVNVSSIAHRQGTIDLTDLQAERRYSAWGRYGQSKLANLLFTFELQRRSDAGGWGIMSNAAHPGFARTELIPNGPGTTSLLSRISMVLFPIMSQSAADGALPSLFAATSPEATGGGYYGPDGLYELKGQVRPAYVARKAKNIALAGALWDASEQLTRVRWPAL